MMSRPPKATYRIQLRGGVDFDDVRRHLDYFSDLGVSHLYLSPIFTAATGSTHGYDVINPNEIDPVLGGRPAFERLANASRQAGLGIILDIVPNHTAFTLENPWLREVLMHGRQSRWARHFDVDWEAGPLVLPILPEPFEKMLLDGRFSVHDGHFVFDETAVPLRTDARVTGAGRDALRHLHARQHWRLRHWEAERDSITHRRFFNVTSLIGMRVEDPQVFADLHALTLDLVKRDLVDGLRVDHIDGLADPAEYLQSLAQALPGTPVWVEKILVGDERLPDGWKTVGTTGYEAARVLAASLTWREGIERIDAIWRAATDTQDPFSASLAKAKREVLENELAAEMHQLVALASKALEGSALAEPGPETLREAVMALLTATPRYRTYIDAGGTSAEDRALIAAVVEQACIGLRSRLGVEAVASLLLDPTSEVAQRFAFRFQQVSGALLAKSQEDTAGFRWTRFLAANEVGAEPAEPTLDEERISRFLSGRSLWDMNLTSTHDTKRSEDSRMRLVAISHAPDAFAALYSEAAQQGPARAVDPQWRWYIVQTCLAIWDRDDPDQQSRIAGHIRKAMREAKQTSFWTKPNEEAETDAIAFADAIQALWRTGRRPELETLLALGDALILAQVMFKCVMPGFPDIYRGCEGVMLALTDPDNRRPVDWDALAALQFGHGVSALKFQLTRQLLRLRDEEKEFLSAAASGIVVGGDKRVLFKRTDGKRQLVAGMNTKEARCEQILWETRIAGHVIFLGWDKAERAGG